MTISFSSILMTAPKTINAGDTVAIRSILTAPKATKPASEINYISFKSVQS